MDSKTLVLIGTIVTIILGVIASIVAWFAGGQKLQGKEREAIRQMFNFEISCLILAILIGWIPLLGQLFVFGIWIANIVYSIKTFNAVNSDSDIAVPGFNLIK